MRNQLLVGWDAGAELFFGAVTRIVSISPSAVASLPWAFGSCFSQLLEIIFVEFSVAITKAARFWVSATVGLTSFCCSGWRSRRQDGFL